jgi:hypothetical protein
VTMTPSRAAFIPAQLPRTFDAVVGSGGRADYATLQAADDVLDAGAYSMWVQQGTYAAGVTVATNNVYIFFEPGTVVQAAMTFSGDGITVVLGAQCDVQGLITLSGANGSLICHGGVDTDGLLISGNNCFHDGGGWDTLHNGGTANNGITITGTDCIVQNCSVQTTAGTGDDLDGVSIEAARGTVRGVKVIDSTERGIFIPAAGAVDSLIESCTVLGADSNGIDTKAPRTRIIGNYVIAAGNDGIQVGATADDSIVVGNIVKDQATQAIDIHGDAENCVIVGNRVDDHEGDGSTGVVDNSGTSTEAGNDETAF